MQSVSFAASVALTFALATGASAQSPDDLVLQIRSFVVGDGAAVVKLEVTNRAPASVANVMIECGFMSEDDEPLNIGYRIIGNIKTSQTGSEQLVALADQRVKKTNCRVLRIF